MIGIISKVLKAYMENFKNIILIIVSCFHLNVIANEVEIKVNVAYSVDSPWTENEIRERFKNIDLLFSKACSSLKISIGEIIPISESENQDIDGSLTSSGVNQILKILAKFSIQRKPTIFYTRNGKAPGYTEMSPHIGKAFMLGGPRPLSQFAEYEWNDLELKKSFLAEMPFLQGNLSWKRYDELKELHGLILIAQSDSNNYVDENFINFDQKRFVVDAHEIGHILTNDGSHRNINGNLMSGGPTHDKIDSDQCELMKAYLEQESLRDLTIKSEMEKDCKVYFDYNKLNPHNTATVPKYCFQKK